MTTTAAQPVISLYPYQARFFADRHRVLVGLWCRQAGKDFATASLAVDDAFQTHRAWYIVSKSQRQADATFAKCKQVAAAFREVYRIVGAVEESSEEYIEHDRDIDHEFRHVARTLHLPGGGTVTALPGLNPDTLAGLSGNIIFTEFGLFARGGYDHWRVIFPLTTRGYRVVVISTPRGRNTKLYDLCQDPETYSIHRVDIHRAVAEGMPLTDNEGRPCTIEAFRTIYGDEVGWRREYELEFSGDLEALVKWAQLQAAGEIGRQWPFRRLEITGQGPLPVGLADALRRDLAAGGRLEIGWDVARHRDLSAVWCNLALRGQVRALGVLVLMRDVPFAHQRDVIRMLMRAAPGGVGRGDATGLGADSNETLTREFPGRWEGVTFTARTKSELASGLATAIGDGTQAIPPTDGESQFVATDLYALQRDPSVGTMAERNIRVTESENPLLPDSHCDIAWAAALALRAGQCVTREGYLWVA